MPDKQETKVTSLVEQTKGIIKKAGPKGISALDIATQMKLVTKDMKQVERSSALKKVRTLARKAIGGKPASKKDGRSAIYTMPN